MNSSAVRPNGQEGRQQQHEFDAYGTATGRRPREQPAYALNISAESVDEGPVASSLSKSSRVTEEGLTRTNEENEHVLLHVNSKQPKSSSRTNDRKIGNLVHTDQQNNLLYGNSDGTVDEVHSSHRHFPVPPSPRRDRRDNERHSSSHMYVYHGMHPSPWVSTSRTSSLGGSLEKIAAFPSMSVEDDKTIPKFIKQHVGAPAAKAISAQQERLRSQLAAFLEKRTLTTEVHKDVIANHFSGLKGHAEVGEQIVYEIKHLERLIAKLEKDTTVESYEEPLETLAGQRRRAADAEEEEIGEILNLRSSAALLAVTREFDEVSVEDYSTEPPLPTSVIGGANLTSLLIRGGDTEEADAKALNANKPKSSALTRQPVSEANSKAVTASTEAEEREQQKHPTHPESHTMKAIIDGIAVSLRKAHFSLFNISQLTIDNPLWFASHLVARKINTHAIRANYHARKVHGWASLLRSSVFTLSSTTNQSTKAATREIIEENRRLAAVAKKEALLESRRDEQLRVASEAAADAKRIEAEIQRVDGELMRRFQVFSDPDVAETMALLTMLEPIERLRPFVDEVRQWLEVQDALGKPSCSLRKSSVAGFGFQSQSGRAEVKDTSAGIGAIAESLRNQDFADSATLNFITPPPKGPQRRVSILLPGSHPDSCAPGMAGVSAFAPRPPNAQ